VTESDISKQSKWCVIFVSFEGPESDINKLERDNSEKRVMWK